MPHNQEENTRVAMDRDCRQKPISGARARQRTSAKVGFDGSHGPLRRELFSSWLCGIVRENFVNECQ